MRRNGLAKLTIIATLTMLTGANDRAAAQVDCEAIPAGPARTDCYIGLARINRQKSEIAASTARQQGDAATYRRVTGSRPGKKTQRPAPAPQWDQDWSLGWPR